MEWLAVFPKNTEAKNDMSRAVSVNVAEVAVEYERNAILEWLLKQRICPNADLNQMLLTASRKGFTRCITVLFDRSVTVELARLRDTVITDFELPKPMLEREIDRKSTSQALDEAIVSKHLEAVQVLLDRGADANERVALIGPPLHRAVDVPHLEIVKILVKAGANVQAIWAGQTAAELARLSIASEEETRVLEAIADYLEGPGASECLSDKIAR